MAKRRWHSFQFLKLEGRAQLLHVDQQGQGKEKICNSNTLHMPRPIGSQSCTSKLSLMARRTSNRGRLCKWSEAGRLHCAKATGATLQLPTMQARHVRCITLAHMRKYCHTASNMPSDQDKIGVLLWSACVCNLKSVGWAGTLRRTSSKSCLCYMFHRSMHKTGLLTVAEQQGQGKKRLVTTRTESDACIDVAQNV